jgi:hypothetical protein
MANDGKIFAMSLVPGRRHAPARLREYLRQCPAALATSAFARPSSRRVNLGSIASLIQERMARLSSIKGRLSACAFWLRSIVSLIRDIYQQPLLAMNARSIGAPLNSALNDGVIFMRQPPARRHEAPAYGTDGKVIGGATPPIDSKLNCRKRCHCFWGRRQRLTPSKTRKPEPQSARSAYTRLDGSP